MAKPGIMEEPSAGQPKGHLQLCQQHCAVHCAIYRGQEEQQAHLGKIMTRSLSPPKETRI